MSAKSIAGVVALALAVGVGFYIAKVSTPPLGSASSPSVVGGCMDVNGITQCYTKKGFAQATTTVCAIKSPTATSTLADASVYFRVSSSTASTVTLAKATTAFATTSAIETAAIGAGEQGAVVATTTARTAGLTTFAPNTYLVVGMAGGIGTFSPTGSCSAVFRVL